MVRQALRILAQALSDLWENIFTFTVANVVWAFSLIPGFGVALLINNLIGLVLGLLVIGLTTGPVTVGLYSLTVEVGRREKIDFGDLWRGIRQYYRRGWLLGVLNVVFIMLAVVNFSFYTSPGIQGTPLSFAIFLWAYIVFTWFVMQLYLWPLAVRMEQFKLVGVFRNTLLATFKYPVLSLTLGLIVGVIFLASSFIGYLPIMLFGIAFHGLVGNKALSTIVAREQSQVAAQGGDGTVVGPYQVDVPPLPPIIEPAPEPTYTTRNTPPGVKRRGSQKEM